MVRHRTSWLVQLVTIAAKGAEARRAGLPRESPYKGRKGVDGQRMRAWLEGWDAAEFLPGRMGGPLS